LSYLRPCPLCGSANVRLVETGMHFSYVFPASWDETPGTPNEEGTIAYNFHDKRFVHCVDCSLTKPDLDDLHPDELPRSWNQRDGEPMDDPCRHLRLCGVNGAYLPHEPDCFCGACLDCDAEGLAPL
jgi:hypothetical protein